jgi:hypothetical protein
MQPGEVQWSVAWQRPNQFYVQCSPYEDSYDADPNVGYTTRIGERHRNLIMTETVCLHGTEYRLRTMALKSGATVNSGHYVGLATGVHSKIFRVYIFWIIINFEERISRIRPICAEFPWLMQNL